MPIATSRADLRYRIGVLLGDVKQVTATTDGTTTTFTDSLNVSDTMERPLGRDIVFISGFSSSNVGLVRRVTSSTSLTGTLSFAALPDVTITGDVAHLFNYRTKGWQVQEYDNAIDQAMMEGGRTWKSPENYLVTPAFDGTSTGITVPATLSHIAKIGWLASDNTVMQIPKAKTRNDPGWYISADEFQIQGSYWQAQANGYNLYINGYKDIETLADDSDTTTMPADYIVYKAASLLCLNGRDRDPANYNMGMLYREDAEKRRPLSRLAGGTVAIGVV